MNILTWTAVRDELSTPLTVNSPGPVATLGEPSGKWTRVSE